MIFEILCKSVIVWITNLYSLNDILRVIIDTYRYPRQLEQLQVTLYIFLNL